MFTTSKVNKGIFDQVIGAHESLFIQIKQLKAAARYPGNGLPILLTGPTGSGKTTLLRLLLREHDLEQGDILLNGRRTN